MMTTGIKVFSDWWIGQVRSITTMSDTSKMLIYIGLVIGFGCMFGIAALVALWTSNKVTK
jgi:hypothetical protein